jgi:hypothetical protein
LFVALSDEIMLEECYSSSSFDEEEDEDVFFVNDDDDDDDDVVEMGCFLLRVEYGVMAVASLFSLSMLAGGGDGGVLGVWQYTLSNGRAKRDCTVCHSGHQICNMQWLGGIGIGGGDGSVLGVWQYALSNGRTKRNCTVCHIGRTIRFFEV